MARKKTASNFLERMGEYSWLLTILVSLGAGGFGSYVTSKIENNDRDHRITKLEQGSISAIEFALEQQKLNNLISIVNNTKQETNQVLSDFKKETNQVLTDLTKRLTELEGTLKTLNVLLDRLERKDNK